MSDLKTPRVLIHVPHSSLEIPIDLRDQFLLNDTELSLELDRLTDHYTDQLFASTRSNVKTLLFPVSRFVVDPERFDDDMQEPMAARGHGVIYTGTTGGDALRRVLGENERASLLERYYIPHHEALTTAAEQSLAANGSVTIIDAHSFPDTPLHVDLSQSVPRPDICLGTVAKHTPPELIKVVKDQFVNAGYSVNVDKPYAGTIVPLQYYDKDARVSSIMIEINRKLYLDGEPGSLVRSESFAAVQNTIQSVIESVISWTMAQEKASF